MARFEPRSAHRDPAPGGFPSGSSEPLAAARTPAASASLGSLADLPVAGLTRRRIALVLGALVAAWVIVLFARQIGEAGEATARADGMRASNVVLAAEVDALEAELALIQRQAYIEQQAREYRLGGPREIPVVLAADAPPLPANAPGSASVRLGQTADRPSPFDSWLQLLFGPAGDPADLSRAPAGG